MNRSSWLFDLALVEMINILIWLKGMRWLRRLLFCLLFLLNSLLTLLPSLLRGVYYLIIPLNKYNDLLLLFFDNDFSWALLIGVLFEALESASSRSTVEITNHTLRLINGERRFQVRFDKFYSLSLLSIDHLVLLLSVIYRSSWVSWAAWVHIEGRVPNVVDGWYINPLRLEQPCSSSLFRLSCHICSSLLISDDRSGFDMRWIVARLELWYQICQLLLLALPLWLSRLLLLYITIWIGSIS